MAISKELSENENPKTIKRNNFLPNYDDLILNNTNFPYPYNVIVAPEATIGKNCTIHNGATIGTNRRHYPSDPKLYPTLGDNVIVGPNACVIGPVKVGNNVIIGAGAIVVKDIPDNCLATGNPITITKR